MLRPILIVEDFEDDIFQLVRTLKKTQIENAVNSVNSAPQAIDYLQGNGIYADREKFPLPGLIFLDLYMSGPDGFSVLQFLRSNVNFEAIPVVILTGSVALPDVTKAYDLGAVAFLSKPCREDDLKRLPPVATQWLRFAPTVS
jgi:CheY-like chemotaxis protein